MPHIYSISVLCRWVWGGGLAKVVLLDYNKYMANTKTIKKERYCAKRPWVKTLKNIRQRCNNPNDPKYVYYGGKGIKTFLSRNDIMEIWFRDKADMMKQPSIDRIDSDGNYTLKNSRFIEMAENRKRSHASRGA